MRRFRTHPVSWLPLVVAGALALVVVGAPVRAQTTREVAYTAHSVIRVNAKLRVTTLIALPDTEDILDIVCGDKEYWVVSGVHNLAYVKPARAGAVTTLDLVTASGHVYAFWLTEGSADADVELLVKPDEALADMAGAAHRYFSASDMDAAKRALDQAKKDAEAARDLAAKSAEDAEASRLRADQSATARVDAFRASYPTTLAFPYLFKEGVRPFNVSAIFHDDKFTYIRATPTELPTLYEVTDGTPNLVTFQVENGVFVVGKVLDRGYLVIGKSKFSFGTTWR